MKKFCIIWGREVSACFSSPVAYVTMIIFLAVTGGTFVSEVFQNEGTNESLSAMLCAAIVVWLTILISVISMRLFAEEKRAGTLETLLTAPVSDAAVVLGKYAGALSFLFIVTAPAVAYVYILRALSPGIDFVDGSSLLSGCIALLLVAAFCLAIGVLVSLTTRNQIVAAICCFTLIWIALLGGTVMTSLPGGTEFVDELTTPLTHIEDFSRGSIDTRPIVLYLSATVFLLFTSVRALESRRWK